MTVFEYKDDILIVDMGFLFPDADMPGVDYIIPDVSYLEEKKHKIRGAIITHGHLDHIGAIPYLIEKLGFPTMYGTPVTMGLVKNRLEEFNLLGMGKIATIDPTKDVLQLGSFTVRPFRLIHSIPGSIGLEIETSNGRISYCTDWKFDYAPAEGQQVDLRELAAVGTRGVDLLFSDSTNATKPGHTISEKVIEAELDKSVAAADGRVVIAMFASSLARVQQTINIAAKHNRKVVIVGRSMQKNIEMMVSMRAMTIPPNTMISDRELTRFNDNQILVLTTGAQGEERAGLNRMASGEHKTIKVRKGDTVIISASPIPGNEKSVNGVMNLLYKAGATVIYNVTADVHSSGHAYAEDLKLMLALMRPNYFLPLHGERPKLVAHGKLAEEVGVNPNNVIIADNGSIVEMDHTGRVFLTESHVPAGYVMVDGLGVGDVGTVVIRDRQVMAKEGVFVTISVFNKARKQFIGSPDIISRGFIYMRENERFVNDIRSTVRTFLASHEQALRGPDDMAELKNDLRSMLEKLLREKTEREPMVIPVVIEI
jgi:ribonuclease J